MVVTLTSTAGTTHNENGMGYPYPRCMMCSKSGVTIV